MPNVQKPFSESGSSPPITVHVLRIDLTPGSTVGIGYATDPKGREISFSADWRPLLAIGEALKAGVSVTVTLADWQVICWRAGR
jgi:hypothetical protein